MLPLTCAGMSSCGHCVRFWSSQSSLVLRRFFFWRWLHRRKTHALLSSCAREVLELRWIVPQPTNLDRSLSLFNRVIAGRWPRTCSGERGFHCLVIYFTPKEYLQAHPEWFSIRGQLLIITVVAGALRYNAKRRTVGPSLLHPTLAAELK